jgi:hypothetical protein
MSDVTNGLLAINKNYILNFDGNTSFSGTALSTYNVNTQNLEAAAAKVSESITSYIANLK